MKIWQWSRCIVCPHCGAEEHQPCRHIATKRVCQYHPERLKAGRELRDEMNMPEVRA